jgi:hypothetical protein
MADMSLLVVSHKIFATIVMSTMVVAILDLEEKDFLLWGIK